MAGIQQKYKGQEWLLNKTLIFTTYPCNENTVSKMNIVPLVKKLEKWGLFERVKAVLEIFSSFEHVTSF